jgi:hypothetical protein
VQSCLCFLTLTASPAEACSGGYYEAGVDPEHRDALLCGPVTYLAPPGAKGYPVALEPMINPHPARPAPPDGDVVSSADYELFWSLSFARHGDVSVASVTPTTDMAPRTPTSRRPRVPRVFRCDGSGRTCFSSVAFRVGSPG